MNQEVSVKVNKAVIPVAGLGSRMLPATKSIPKEMLPLVDKPLIQYVVNEAVMAGIKEIVLVTHSSKSAIENHFDANFELEHSLDKKEKYALLEDVRSILPDDVSVISVRQPVPLGLGHAVLSAFPVVGEQPFVVLLPDVIIDEYQSNLRVDNLAAMIERFEETGINQIMVEPVPENKVNQYGVVDLKGVNISAGDNAVIFDMVEKPSIEQAPSNLAITGRYVLSPKIFQLLSSTKAGAGGEIQLTDALHQLRLSETIEAYLLKGRSHDCGSKLGYLLAIVEYAINNRELGSQFIESLNGLLARIKAPLQDEI